VGVAVNASGWAANAVVVAELAAVSGSESVELARASGSEGVELARASGSEVVELARASGSESVGLARMSASGERRNSSAWSSDLLTTVWPGALCFRRTGAAGLVLPVRGDCRGSSSSSVSIPIAVITLDPGLTWARGAEALLSSSDLGRDRCLRE
jgi:hypothetical protein